MTECFRTRYDATLSCRLRPWNAVVPDGIAPAPIPRDPPTAIETTGTTGLRPHFFSTPSARKRSLQRSGEFFN